MHGLKSAIRNSQFAICASLILVALLAAAPLWGPGMVNTRGGGDSPFLLQRTHQLLVNLRAGVFPVRWMPDAAYGLGYPFFSYYAALPYYLAGLLALAGLDLLTTLKLVQTLGFVAAALAMYGWMNGMTENQWAAWLAAVAYTVAPFHLVNVYVRGDSLSEFYAFIFYPLILWSLDGISESVSQRISKSASRQVCKSASLQVAAVASSFAGLLLTHNISAMIFSPFALLYLVMRAWHEKESRWRILGFGFWGLGLGVLLAAWFWFPALAELKYVQLGPSTQDYFHYSRHFRTLDLVQGRLLFDYSTAAGHTVRSPFAMGLVQAGFAVLGGLVLIVRGLRRKLPAPVSGASWRLDARWTFVLLGLLVSTAMITPLSKPLWDYLPLLSIAQFPWRLLSVQALFTAAATAALMPAQSAARNSQFAIRNSLCFALPVAVLLVVSTLLPLHPERLPIGPADVTAERLQLYELFTDNIGTTIRHEWLPETVAPRPFTSDALVEPGAPPRAIPLDGASLEAALVEGEQKPTRQVWRVWGEGGGIAFPLLYWPGWEARVDGKPVEVWPVEGSGYLALEVLPGEHTILLRLGHTPVRAVTEAASLCAWMILAIALLRTWPKIRWSFAVCLLSFVILLLLTLSQKPGFSEKTWSLMDSEADLTMDFIHMPYLHHNPEGVDFGGVARLEGYALSAEELAPGDTLAITLNWAEVEKETYTATVHLVSPAAIRYAVKPLAEATALLSPCHLVTLSSLRLSDDIPCGIYLLQLRLFGPEGELRALTPGGKRRGTLYLRPVRVPHGPSLPPEVSVLAHFGPAIRLHAATVAQLAPHRLAVRLEWSAKHPVAANYGISLRLLDAEGQRRVSLDTQPGYGFLPTSLWRPGELVTDQYVLALPEDLPPDGGCHLEVVIYQVSTREAVGQTRIGDFALPLETPFEAHRPPRAFTLPPLQRILGIDFGGEVRLAGYGLEQGEDALRLTLWWQALQTPSADYTVFVHLFDPATESLTAQNDAQPRGGAYPTSWWAAGEVVSETVTLSLEGVSEGAYRLAVGLYDRTVTRLRAIDPDGQRLPDDRAILPVDIRVGK